MSVLEDVADKLANHTLDLLEAQEDPEDDRIVRQVSEAIGNASPTLQETYLTQMRIRRAERRALQVLQAAGAKVTVGTEATADPVIQLPGPTDGD